jgi:hypothetical protein
MMNHCWNASLALVGALALSGSQAGQSQPGKTFDLQYRLTPGTTFSVTNTVEYASYRETDGRLEKRGSTSAGMALDYRVSSVGPDGALTLEVTYRDRYRAVENAQGIATSLDFRNLLGGRFTYRLGRRGEVGELRGFDKLNVRLGDGKDWSRDQLMAEIEHLLPRLPEHPVRVGDSWRTTIADGPDTDTVEYRLMGEARVDGHDCVRFIARYWNDTDRTDTSGGRSIALKGRSIGNDVYYFAYKEGMLVSRVSTGQSNMGATEAGQPPRRAHAEEMYETRVKLR